MNRPLALTALVSVLAILPRPALPDTVRLKSGRVHSNVKTIPRGKYQFLISKNGQVQRVKTADIERLEVRPVRWESGMQPGQVQSFIEQRIQLFEQQLQKDLRKNIRAEIRAEQKRKAAAAATQRQTRFARTWRSLVWPGWGQYYSGRENLAYVQGGAFAFGLLGYLHHWQRYSKAREAYVDPTLPIVLSLFGGVNGAAATLLEFEQRRRTMERERAHAQNFLLLSGTIAAWSVVEAYYSVGASGGDTQAGLRVDSEGALVAILRFRVTF